MAEIKNFDGKRYFTILMAIILSIDLTILLNIPFLRQILGFLCFTIIPGLLILHILKLNKIEFLKKFVLSVGLSIAFLMFAGLLVNSFYPFISKPLSLFPLLISFNILLGILAFIAYKRNKDDFDIKDVFNFKFDLKDKLISPLLFPILFPFMAVFGTYLMNTQGNNIILLVMLFLIPAYVVAVVYLRNKIPEATYPVAIWMIGMALLLMVGLRSNNLSSGTCTIEYYLFQVTLNNFYWDSSLIIAVASDYNACLSITILPTIYKIFLEIQGEYIFKLIFNLLGSIIPLVLYAIFQKYMHNHHAFISVIFFVSQHTFISMLGWVGFRQLIALLLFSLTILVFFEDKIDRLNKKILFIVFMVSVIVSHYSTAYLFFILIFLYWFASNSREIKLKSTETKSKNITTVIIVLFFVSIFFWYGQTTGTPFNKAILFVENNLMNLVHLSMEGLKHEEMIFPTGETQVVTKITFLIYYISFAFIIIGVFSLIKNQRGFEKGYLLMAFLSCGILVLLTCVSSFISGYGTSRVYLQLLVFLAPSFVIGGEAISKFISRFNPKLNLSLVIIMIVLIAHFFSATYMIYQICGVHHSEFLNSDGIRYDFYYVHDVDIAGAKWIYAYANLKRQYIWGDIPGRRICFQFNPQPILYHIDSRLKGGYIYLRTVNTIDKNIYLSYGVKEDISSCAYLPFETMGKLYSNGGSDVYRY